MELETAARRHLLADRTINGYVGGKVFKQSLLVSPQGTSGMAVVVRRYGGWNTPQPTNTQEYPRLLVDCYADPDRNPDGTVRAENGTDKAWALYRAVDTLLHRVRDVYWGRVRGEPGLRIVTCARDAEPTAIGGPADPSRGRDPLLGDMTLVQVAYAVQSVH